MHLILLEPRFATRTPEPTAHLHTTHDLPTSVAPPEGSLRPSSTFPHAPSVSQPHPYPVVWSGRQPGPPFCWPRPCPSLGQESQIPVADHATVQAAPYRKDSEHLVGGRSALGNSRSSSIEAGALTHPAWPDFTLSPRPASCIECAAGLHGPMSATSGDLVAQSTKEAETTTTRSSTARKTWLAGKQGPCSPKCAHFPSSHDVHLLHLLPSLLGPSPSSRTPKPRLHLASTPQLCLVTCCPSRHGKKAQGGTAKQGLKCHVEEHTTGLLDGQVPGQWSDRQLPSRVPSLRPSPRPSCPRCHPALPNPCHPVHGETLTHRQVTP